MYPFFLRGASTSFSALILVVCGCSGGPSNPPVTLPISPPEIQQSARCVRTTTSPLMYRCESDIGPLFVTTLRDCSIPEKFTFQATTRQLLVGVVDLKVIRQEPAIFDSLKSLHSLVHGTMDVDPFLMSIYTFHEGACVTDLVVWRGSTREVPAAPEVSEFGNVTFTIAHQLVSTLVPAKELTRAKD